MILLKNAVRDKTLKDMLATFTSAVNSWMRAFKMDVYHVTESDLKKYVVRPSETNLTVNDLFNHPDFKFDIKFDTDRGWYELRNK